MRFQGKVALISAAGAGIGRATAMIIAREGGTIVAVDVEPAVLDRLTADIGAAGGRVLAIRADALDAGSVDGAVRQAVDAYGRIDILVNGVGGSTVVSRPAALLDELTLEDWQKLLHFNLTGTFLFSHAVIPVMKRQRSGKIVNLAS
ncbi:MAG TPA: SDR family NAD(P)-dependent oxidoreductase, partial [Methylomirabilota bacterium]|nr:SDR family NAD(P)-dependent oxidoreductase [Methylomirabilota bacterium]